LQIIGAFGRGRIEMDQVRHAYAYDVIDRRCVTFDTNVQLPDTSRVIG
jgi:hypothetical protein